MLDVDYCQIEAEPLALSLRIFSILSKFSSLIPPVTYMPSKHELSKFEKRASNGEIGDCQQ